MGEKLKLYGFNNLTKSLSFNIYDVCYAKTPREQRDYIDYIDEQYNSKRLTNILTNLTDMIGEYLGDYTPMIGDDPDEVVLAELGNDAGIYGAAKLVLED